MDNQQENLAFMKGWIVGVIDSSGWIVLQVQKKHGQILYYQPRIGFNSACEKTLDRADEFFKKLDLAFYRTSNTIKISGIKRCDRFLKTIHPILFTEKCEKLKALQKFIEYRLSVPKNAYYTKEDYDLWHKVKELKG